MDDGALKAVIQGKIQNAISYQGGRLAQLRMQAERYYRGDKFGNEVPGRSQVISRDVAEAVDSMMPALLRIFASSDEPVRFEPGAKHAPEGAPLAATLAMIKQAEEQAKQATDYVGWIWNQQNEGFHIFYTWFKSSLMFKNGVVKIWWDDSVRTNKETYEGLTDDELQQLLTSDEVSLISLKSYPDPDPPMAAAAPPPPQAPAGAGGAVPPSAPPPQPQSPGAPPASPMGSLGSPAAPPEPPMLHDAIVRFTNKDGRVRVMTVPEDEFLIDRRALPFAIEDPPFCAHRFKMAITDITEMFPDKKGVIADLPTGEEAEYGMERLERFKDEDELPWRQDNPADPSMREVWLTECYLRVDYDQDGIAEMRKITVAGDTGYVILDNEEVDDHPFAALTPIPMPHKFFGMSVADQTIDIQLIKSTLIRGYLDNLYNSIAPQLKVIAGQVNLDDLMNRKPGGIVRVKDMNAVDALANPAVDPNVMQAVEYLDTVREQRTGVTRYNQGLDADTLNKTAKGIGMIQQAGNERLELIARVFAETGVKRAFKRILELVCKHQQRARMIRLRGKWVSMDPREWTNEMDISTNVGLGTGSRDQQMQVMNMLLNVDKEIIQLQGGINGPVLTAQNVYEKLRKLCEWAQFKNPDLYYTDPTTAPQQQPQQPKPDPKMVEAQAKAQAQQVQTQADLQEQQARLQGDMAMQKFKTQQEMQLNQQRAQFDAQLERQKAESAMQLEQVKLAHKTHLDAITAHLKAMQPRPMGAV